MRSASFDGGKIQIIISRVYFTFIYFFPFEADTRIYIVYNRTEEVRELFGLISPLLVSWYLERNNVMQHEYANSTSRKYSCT